MRRGFKYWWKDHKRAVLAALLGGVLFVIANLDRLAAFMPIAPDAWPAWLVLLAGVIVTALIGLLFIMLTWWALSLAVIIAWGIGRFAWRIIGERINEDQKTFQTQSNALFQVSLGLSLAYWIGYKFYMLWIK
jgi:hypothetical protein